MFGPEPGPWRREAQAFTRAFSGAFLFGVPLLFTMEMWWIGVFADLWKLLVLLGLAFVVNLHLIYFAGFKDEGHTLHAVLDQAVDAIAVGIVASTAVLFVLNRISPGDPLDSIAGKIIAQAVPLSIGASAANAIFSRREGRQGEGSQMHPHLAVWNDIGATAAGAIFIGFAIAPTDEIPMLAAQLDYWHELALIGVSLVITYGIVFASGFDPRHPHKVGLWQRPFTETVLAYVVSLLVALTALFLFDRIELSDPPAEIVSQAVVLGLPAAIGGAAGRLVI
jgi:putative integral membrane protein (TIGR02587 family)